jgi:hypothetical protein
LASNGQILFIDKFDKRFEEVKCLAIEAGQTDLKNKSFAQLVDFWDLAKKNVG